MSKPVTVTVELDTPIKRNQEEVAKLTLRKPMSGELRGLSLADLINMDVDSITRVMPRISNPALTEQEVREMARLIWPPAAPRSRVFCCRSG